MGNTQLSNGTRDVWPYLNLPSKPRGLNCSVPSDPKSLHYGSVNQAGGCRLEGIGFMRQPSDSRYTRRARDPENFDICMLGGSLEVEMFDKHFEQCLN